MGAKYDFCGWATRNDLECSDGRIIRQDAFKHCDGKKVPLVYMHNHEDVNNVLGHCILKNKPQGVYTYGYFNSTKEGQHAKEMLQHDDVDGLSIWANHLTQNGNSDGSIDVVHGDIKEVSLVLSGANPGALIDTVMLEHFDDGVDENMIIYPNLDYSDAELLHGDSMPNDDIQENTDDMTSNEEPKSEENEELEMADEKEAKETKERTVQDVIDEMSDEQLKTVNFLIDQALKEAGVEIEEDDEGEEAAQSDFEGENEMKHNVFDGSQEMNEETNVMSQDDMKALLLDAKARGSLKDAILAHDDATGETTTVEYGIDGMEDVLFPEAKLAGDNPNIIARDTTWVADFLGAAHKSPFSRVKSIAADLTADEARARGYIKAHQKVDEVISMFKRKVEPQTVYKRQKFDRDDLLDITDFNVIAFIKNEMKGMLREEIARAGLVGDGRGVGTDGKINPEHIIPVYSDSNVYSVQVKVDVEHGALGNDKAKAFIDACVRAKKQYKGSGNPTAFMTEDMLTECLLLEDGIGHKLYKSEAEVATAMRVSKIVTVPVMENITNATNGDLAAIILNPIDYTFGADKGGEETMFDDFDIDFNQYIYLLETRLSGALTKPYSALVVSIKEAAA